MLTPSHQPLIAIALTWSLHIWGHGFVCGTNVSEPPKHEAHDATGQEQCDATALSSCPQKNSSVKRLNRQTVQQQILAWLSIHTIMVDFITSYRLFQSHLATKLQPTGFRSGIFRQTRRWWLSERDAQVRTESCYIEMSLDHRQLHVSHPFDS